MLQLIVNCKFGILLYMLLSCHTGGKMPEESGRIFVSLQVAERKSVIVATCPRFVSLFLMSLRGYQPEVFARRQ